MTNVHVNFQFRTISCSFTLHSLSQNIDGAIDGNKPTPTKTDLEKGKPAVG
jgi:hypothetical protein